MLKILAFGLATGAGIQGFRNFPASGPVTADGVILLFVVGLAAAYLGGRWHNRGQGNATATAVASATAESAAVATNNVQLAVVFPGQGARSTGIAIPTEETTWMQGAEVRREITANDLDGVELQDLFADLETEDMP